ncbi:hypothetical protein [Microbispora sp. GKU 823]|nr:hypothetical protein [Microbispora sp. GKU 823]
MDLSWSTTRTTPLPAHVEAAASPRRGSPRALAPALELEQLALI